MFGIATEPISKLRFAVIGLGNRGNTLLEMFQYLLENEMAEVIVLSDILEEEEEEGLNLGLIKLQELKPCMMSNQANYTLKVKSLNIGDIIG